MRPIRIINVERNNSNVKLHISKGVFDNNKHVYVEHLYDGNSVSNSEI